MYKIIITLLIFFSMHVVVAQETLSDEFDNAIELLKKKQHKRAAEAFTVLLEKVTTNNEKKYCYIYRGLAYRDIKEYEKAIFDLDKAIALDLNDLASYIDRGEIKMYSNDIDGAIKDFNVIISKQSSGEAVIAAYYYLGNISFHNNQFEQCVAYLDKLLALSPNDAKAYFKRGAAQGMLMDW